MTTLELLVKAPLMQALGWAIFHSLWEGALLAAVLAALLVGVRSAQARYGLACAALAAMVAGFLWSFVSAWPDGSAGSLLFLHAAAPRWAGPTGMDANGTQISSVLNWVPYMAPFWLCGVAICYLRLLAGWQSVYRLQRRGVCGVPDRWQQFVARTSQELNLSRAVSMVESLVLEMPVVIGHFRPVIVVPLGFLSGLPPAQVEAILAHELAHIRRSDFLIDMGQRVVEALLFYHPAVWWISKVIREERENCCDDFVVRWKGGDAHGYATALAKLEQIRTANNWPSREPSLAITGGNLMKRISRLLAPPRSYGKGAFASLAVLLLASCALAAGAWHFAPRQGNAATETANSQQNRWSKWLQQDVVYIISDDEKRAFEQLTTEAEREHFVEQFWARRDPTPGTPENEYKDEHYRRIAFANQHFRSASGTPGWETDRGHMYIVYGPPDEIDAHQKGPSEAYATQVWTYGQAGPKNGPGSFRFVDAKGNGDYRLAPSSGQ